MKSSEAERRTSAAWWAALKQDEGRFRDWLYAQYRGEVTAGDRIEQLRDAYGAGGRARRLLTRIAAQERRHAEWIGGLLAARGLPLEVRPAPERYWAKTLPGIEDLETGAAVGAHAERMRLWRIEAIAADESAPADVRRVFQRILPQERFHERAFRALAGDAALRATADAHERGLEVLGLAP